MSSPTIRAGGGAREAADRGRVVPRCRGRVPEARAFGRSQAQRDLFDVPVAAATCATALRDVERRGKRFRQHGTWAELIAKVRESGDDFQCVIPGDQPAASKSLEDPSKGSPSRELWGGSAATEVARACTRHTGYAADSREVGLDPVATRAEGGPGHRRARITSRSGIGCTIRAIFWARETFAHRRTAWGSGLGPRKADVVLPFEGVCHERRAAREPPRETDPDRVRRRPRSGLQSAVAAGPFVSRRAVIGVDPATVHSAVEAAGPDPRAMPISAPS